MLKLRGWSCRVGADIVVAISFLMVVVRAFIVGAVAGGAVAGGAVAGGAVAGGASQSPLELGAVKVVSVGLTRAMGWFCWPR